MLAVSGVTQITEFAAMSTQKKSSETESVDFKRKDEQNEEKRAEHENIEKAKTFPRTELKSKQKNKRNFYSSTEKKDDFFVKMQCGIENNEQAPRAGRYASEGDKDSSGAGARRRDGGYIKDKSNSRYSLIIFKV